MSRIKNALDALTQTANPAATLAAFTIRERITYPGAVPAALDAPQQKQLRRLERATRMALRGPNPTRYHVLPGDEWFVILAPHAAEHRVYLARAGHQQHYAPGASEPAPIVPPATLLAHWDDNAPLAFAQVVDRDQLNLLMFTSTAHRHTYVTPRAAQSGDAATYTARRPSP